MKTHPGETYYVLTNFQNVINLTNMAPVNDDENEEAEQNGCDVNGGGDTERSTDSEIDPRQAPARRSRTVPESLSDDVMPQRNGNLHSVSSATARKSRQRQFVERAISHATTSRATSLDISGKGLDMIPEDVLRLTELQCLYLAGNQLTTLPEDFFDHLPNLEWLDLRDNQVTNIPSCFLGRHKCLRNLLLENNKLRTLPLELGLLTTLTGLNVRGNPLEFPPLEVRNKGPRVVIMFLRAVLEAKLSGQSLSDPADGFQVGNSVDSESSESENNGALPKSIQQLLANQQPLRLSDGDSLGGPVPLSAALHKPSSYYQLKQLHMDRLKKTAPLRSSTLSGKKAARKTRKKANGNGEVMNGESEVHSRDGAENNIDQRRMMHMKGLREQQDMILHRRKEKELLKEWQDEGRCLQRNKHMDSLVNGGSEHQPVAEHAPFAIDKDQLHMMTNEERIAQGIRLKHENLRRTTLSPRTKQEQEEARSARDQELEIRIKKHTTMMMERRKQPKGTPQEEMEAAKELEMAEQLQREIEQRRKDMDYCFTPFVSDHGNGAYKTSAPSTQNHH